MLPQLPSAQSTPTPHAAAAAMQLAAELVQVPSAQRTWFGGPHESSVEHSAMVARHCSLPSGPHRIGKPAAHGQLASGRRPLDEHCGSAVLASESSSIQRPNYAGAELAHPLQEPLPPYRRKTQTISGLRTVTCTWLR